MQDEQFDDLIRQKLNSEEESVSAGLWSRVKADLPVAKQGVFNRSLLWLLLLFLIPAGAGWYYFTSNQTKISSLEGNRSSKQKVISNIASEVRNTDDKTMQNNSVQSSDHNTLNNSIESNSSQIKYSSNANSTISANNNTVSKTLEPTYAISSTTNFNNQVENSEWDLLNPIQASLPEAASSQALISDKPTLEIKKTKRGIRVFADIYYAPEFAQHTRDLGSSSPAYLKLRRNTETNIYSHSQGIRAGVWLSTNFFFKTGIDMFDMNERLSYTFIPGMGNLPVGMRIDSINGYYINPLTNALVADTIVGSVNSTGEVIISNHYRFVNVPLMFGWRFNKGLWSIQSSTGIYMNIYSGYKGKIIHESMQSLIDISSTSTPYKQNIGIGFSAEVIATYSIFKNIDVLIGPKYNYHLSDISRKGAPIQEKLSSIGMFSGIRYNF